MATGHDLNGLIKFLARDEWQACFNGVFQEHFGAILDGCDIAFGDLTQMLGEHWATVLWGCVFEDFLTQDFEVEDGNIIAAYLKRRGWKEPAQAKAYMKALRTSVMSLYEVSQVVPGKSLLARDLIRGGEPILVSEGSATKTLKQWDRIGARIVTVMGKNIFAGGMLPFTPQASDMLFDALRQMFGKKTAKALPAITDEDLQAVAWLFTQSWLFDTVKRTTTLPTIENADGDELLFHDVRFPFAAGVTQKEVAARVNGIISMAQETAKFWNWLESKPKQNASKRSAPSFDTTMDSGERVLGNIELKAKSLHLSTNSAQRAEAGMRLIEQALGDLLRAPQTETRTIEQLMAEQPANEEAAPASDIPPEIAEPLIHQFMDRQYRAMLDQPISMLGNKTPRQAAKSAADRQKVADWLKYLENQSSHPHNPTDPMATYNFAWMWHELSIIDLRQ